MRTRLLGSFAVVLLGLTPTLIGGPVFALSLVLLGIAGFREYIDMAARLGGADARSLAGIGSFSVAAFALAAFLGGPAIYLFIAMILALAAPLAVVMATNKGSFVAWSLVAVGCLYLGLPIFAAIMLRSSTGLVSAGWLSEMAARLSLGWTAYPRGLAWTIIVVVATWVGDTVAYLVGSSIGGRKLAPRISPNKSVAGAVAGFVGAAIVGAIGFRVFALGNPWIGLVAGGLLGIAGQCGDLAESFLKRQAGVKDSGNLIPGHGGVLDRIDALLFAFPAGLLVAAWFDWMHLQ